ncbi:N-acetylmuramoyl-L-alanine amidase [Paraclostridium benzoelyticum]
MKKQNVEVKLSRTDDSTLSLDGRTSSANNWGADCYVSIHCNSFNKTASGIETFSYTDKTKDLANCIHEEILKTNAFTKNRGLKTANFYVLRKSNMRSCLIELAFIDNELDAKLLREIKINLHLLLLKEYVSM